MSPRTFVSRAFLSKLKLHPEPAYRVAMRAGVNPTTLSKLITGAQALHAGDERIVAVGRQIGLQADRCFATEDADLPA
jgi:hypothetical protein